MDPLACVNSQLDRGGALCPGGALPHVTLCVEHAVILEIYNYYLCISISENTTCGLTLALFTHGKCGAAHINVDRSTFYFVFTQHSVWTGLHRHVSALALRPAHISYCIYTQLIRALYIFAHYTHARGQTSDWYFSRQSVLECHT